MERQRRFFERYIVNVPNNGRFDFIYVNEIRLDINIEKIFKRANLPASLRPENSNETDHESLLILDAIQSPLLVYQDRRGTYWVISGVFTYLKILRSSSVADTLLPAFVLDKPPRGYIKTLILLNELTRSSLKQCFVNNSPDIATFLDGWFDAGGHGVFSTDEWKMLFPGIKNKAAFCRWLGLSSKTFVVKEDKTMFESDNYARENPIFRSLVRTAINYCTQKALTKSTAEIEKDLANYFARISAPSDLRGLYWVNDAVLNLCLLPSLKK
jgi:hypothetical protein